MDDELNLELSPINTNKSGPPKQGRRATTNAFSESSNQPDETLALSSPLKGRPVTQELFLDESGPSARGGPPMKGRRAAGWGEERAKTAKSVRIRSAAQTRFTSDFDEDIIDDNDGDIPVIPDLDDVVDEDMTLQVADAPSVAVNRVATYKELDNDLLKQVAFATLDDIDLERLTHSLAPEPALQERDEAWSWDILFAEITGQLQKEWNPEEEEQEKLEAANERPYTAFNRFAV